MVDLVDGEDYAPKVGEASEAAVKENEDYMGALQVTHYEGGLRWSAPLNSLTVDAF